MVVRASLSEANLAARLGSDRDVASLLRLHEEGRSSRQMRVAFVRGPSGVGKTPFLATLRQRLLTQDVRVFASGGRAERRGPYGLLSGMVAELLAHLAEAGVPPRVISDLQRRTAPIRGGQAVVGDDPALELADAVAELFSLAGRANPTFIFADLDSADAASLQLVRYLLAAGQTPSSAAAGLFVLSYRDDVAPPGPLAEILAKVGGLSVVMSGLDLDGIRAYLTRREVAERLLEVTHGNPALLEQVIRSTPDAQPEDLFLQRIRRLPAADQDVLAALAVRGNPTTTSEIASALVRSAGQAPLDIEERVRRMTRARLLASTPRAATEQLTFAREADREVLYGALPDPQRRGLHLAWGEQLQEARSAPEEVARHLLLVGPGDAARDAALKAGRALADRLAFDDAVGFILQALELTPSEGRGALHEQLSELYRQLAEYPRALRHVGLWRRSLPESERRRARARAAQLLVTMGRLESAEKQLARVLGVAPHPDADAASAQAWVERAEVAFLRGAYEQALALCAEGRRALAHRTDLIASLRNTEGKTHLVRGAFAEAEAAFTENLNAATAANQVRETAHARLNLGVVAHRRGDKRAAIAAYRAALGDLDRKGQAHALSNLGSLYAESGDFEAAIEHLGRALSAFTRARRRKEVAHCSGNLARLHVFLGDFTRAEELIEHMAEAAVAVGDPYLQASAGLIAAELAEARGNPNEAAPAFQAAAARFSGLRSPRYEAEAALGEARTALALGDRAAARVALATTTLSSVAATTPVIAAERERVAGELALVAGELPEATRRLARAKELLLAEPDLEGPYQVYAQLARLRAASGDASGAAADAARASRLLGELVGQVAPHRREAFAKVARRAQVLADAADHEITPARMKRALDLNAVGGAHESLALVGRCEGMARVLRMLPPIARSSSTVLVRGESGTGKELVAEAIHQGSPRAHMPLVKVNCAAMVEDLLMSELFGHERGSFTGAVRERKGRFELADGGTLFLDEIGDVSPRMQVALLRVLQEREFERVGGTKTLHVDVRVIAATNRDLEDLIQRGLFRQDLYYRLKGVAVDLPALRERGGDLSLLCSHFLLKVANERREEPKTLSPEALQLLEEYSFPGNVRELENILSSGTLFANGRVVTPEAFEHLSELREPRPELAAAKPLFVAPSVPPQHAAPTTPRGEIDYFELARSRDLSLKDLRQEIELQCIRRALNEGRGNISEAARLLKMKRSRLSQIVNAEPELRSLSKGDAVLDEASEEEDGE